LGAHNQGYPHVVAFATDPLAKLGYGDRGKSVNLDKGITETASNIVGQPTSILGPYRQLNKMKTELYTLVLTSLIALCLSYDSLACTCSGIPSVNESIEQSDIIVSGKVISIDYVNSIKDLSLFQNRIGTLHMTEIQMKVVKLILDHNYQGWTISDTVTIVTPAFESACGFNFEIGKRYIVSSVQNKFVKKIGMGPFSLT
jgi:hypothetical protein